MFVEQLRVSVEGLKNLVKGLAVGSRSRSESQNIRVIPTELVVRLLEGREDRAFASQPDEKLECWVRVLVGRPGAGGHAYRVPGPGDVRRAPSGSYAPRFSAMSAVARMSGSAAISRWSCFAAFR